MAGVWLRRRRVVSSCRSADGAFLRDGTLPDATGSRHRTQPAHAGVSGHRTTVDSLELFNDVTTTQPTPTPALYDIARILLLSLCARDYYYSWFYYDWSRVFHD